MISCGGWQGRGVFSAGRRSAGLGSEEAARAELHAAGVRAHTIRVSA